MNRQQFLAELNQYLTFFSPEERAKIIAEYTQKFDSVSTEGEAELLLQLGTPMVVAIDLKRKKEAGESIFEESAAEKTNSNTEEDNLFSKYNVETETLETITASEEESKDSEDTVPESKPVEVLVKKNSSGAKFAFAMIGVTLVSIPIALIFIALAGVGIMLVVAMGYLLLTGLKNLLYITDALFLFAGGLVAGGLGLLIIWFAIWSAIGIISRLFRSAIRLMPDSDGKERDA